MQTSWRFRALLLAVVSFASFLALEAALPQVAHASASSPAGTVVAGSMLGLAVVIFAASVVASSFCWAATRGWRRALPVLVNVATIVWIYLQD